MPNEKHELGALRHEVYETNVEKLKDLPNRTQAKFLREEYPHLFKSIEAARSFIRAAKGAKGGDQTFENDPLFKKEKSTISDGLKKLKIYEESKPESIVLTDCKAVLFSDIHFPFQDELALETAVNYAIDYKPDVIILNGDILDCYAGSRYTKEIDKPSLAEEMEVGREFFKLLREFFPKARIIYKLGNHEERLRNYILQNARELADFEQLSFKSLLSLESLNIDLVEREIIKLGKLNVLHGHELGESVFSPVNPARGMFLKAKCSTIFGHHHQISHHSESTLNGDSTGVWSMGTLGTLTPEYRPFAYTKWAHGFATVEVAKNGTYKVNNMRIIDGEIV